MLHPESSWLQWLNELGLIPLALLVFAFGRLVFPRLGGLFERRGTFYLSAGALAGVAGLVAHALIDVPAHRWGTAGFALALLGLACPVKAALTLWGASFPRVAKLPLAVSIFWALPFFALGPAWQPVVVEQLCGREASGQLPRPALKEWQRTLRYFPLARDLHHFAALRELENGVPKTADWQKHIEIVHRLVPGGWRFPISHARAVTRLSPALCIQYWQLAIERSGWRGIETLGQAFHETAGLPRADILWADYVQAKPELALAYAKMLPEEDGRKIFLRWWNSRATAQDLTKGEIADFYHFAARWATGDQVEQWIGSHGKRRAEEYLIWVSLLHSFGRDERAWTEYRLEVPEPAYPARSSGAKKAEIENRIRMAPENSTHLLELVWLVAESGDPATERRMIIEAARKPGAAPWFLRKGAYLLAKEGNFRDAVALALRER